MPVYLVSYDIKKHDKNLVFDDKVQGVVENAIIEINSRSNCRPVTNTTWYLDSPKPPNEISSFIKAAVRDQNKKVKLSEKVSTSDISLVVHELSHLYVIDAIKPNTYSWIAKKLPQFKLTKFRPVEFEDSSI